MPLELQVKLLRVLETGSSEPRRRHRDRSRSTCGSSPRRTARPEEAVAAGKLREDLLYRLNVLPDRAAAAARARRRHRAARRALPRRAQRGGGQTAKRFTSAALRAAARPRLAGQRARAAERRAARLHPGRGRDRRRRVLPLGPPGRGRPGSRRPGARASARSIAEAERRLILATLEHFEGDKKKAAEILKISLKTLYNRLNVYHAGG